ncbi:sporulation lipoprotein, YhcN/YlaJ family [Natronincola peptidivorans]|uniref:Sporulation lipoprotein, YhcN/YlaJ family n=1 Tax=Natronincola peptidivorans TaxID=426128 RepID=A0A1H9Y698_9FIRM|nr:YhcN/YlaJ family sporulation lipoprotein [Natronincola peptidivorans]SES64423.1 sporulation lipoprotein, YhcN/YlaJ family [Natronincola peptidivorans]
MKNKKLLLIICIFLIIAMAITGCRPARRPVPEEAPPAPVPGEQADDGTVREMRDPEDDRTAPRNMQPVEMEQDLMIRADRIVNEVVRLEEVRSATVVISENTALVGVTLADRDREEIDRDVEKRIEETVKEADRHIDRVAVTADPDLFSRIESIAREAGRGRPLSGFGREIEEIFRRITPKA